MTHDEIWKLYTDGKIEAAKDAATRELTDQLDQQQEEFHAILAWCAYRRGQFALALARIGLAGENQRAKECNVYVLAYAKEQANDARLMKLVAELGDNINASNALVIRARMPDSIVGHEYVWAMAEKWAEAGDVANHDVSLANLLHNCSRFFLDKARSRRDLKFALGLIKVALAHYGDVANWHHRAAAMFWASHILERLTAIPDAFRAATASLHLWSCQLQLEKDTAPFKDKLENAQRRVVELAAKMVEFAMCSGVKAK